MTTTVARFALVAGLLGLLTLTGVPSSFAQVRTGGRWRPATGRATACLRAAEAWRSSGSIARAGVPFARAGDGGKDHRRDAPDAMRPGRPKEATQRMFRRKPAPDLIRGGYRFAVKNMRHSTNSAAAAEAAGAAVSQVFLAVRAGGRRNGRGRGEGQSKGQNELRHCHLLWVLVSFGGGPHARPPVFRCRASPRPKTGCTQHMAGYLAANRMTGLRPTWGFS
jgi:hypothetical protein